MLRKILMLRIILLIGNICCLLILMLYFLLVSAAIWGGMNYAYSISMLFFPMIGLFIIIIFALNISFISKTGNKLKKLQSQVSSLKKIKKSKKMNIKEFLLIIGNIGLVLCFFLDNLFIWRSYVDIILRIIILTLIIVPLLNIFYIKATSSVGASLSNDNTYFI